MRSVSQILRNVLRWATTVAVLRDVDEVVLARVRAVEACMACFDRTGA